MFRFVGLEERFEELRFYPRAYHTLDTLGQGLSNLNAESVGAAHDLEIAGDSCVRQDRGFINFGIS